MKKLSRLKIFPIAPSGTFPLQKYHAGMKILKSMGFAADSPPPLRPNKIPYLNGTDKERLKETQKALSSNRKTIVWAVKGGYGVTRLLPKIKLSKTKKLPVVAGFSDTTALMLHLWSQHKAKSLHATSVLHLPNETTASLEALFLILRGKAEKVAYPKFKPLSASVKKQIDGVLIPCNLCMLSTLINTPSMPSLKNSILVLEEIGEHPYRIDRMLTHLRVSRALKGVKAVIIGYLTAPEFEANKRKYVSDSIDVLVREFKEMNTPVFGQIPVGHEFPNWPVPLGVKAQIITQSNSSRLQVLENIL